MEFLTVFVICEFSSQLLPANVCVREEFYLDSIHVWYKNYLGILKAVCIYIFRQKEHETFWIK